MQSSSGSDSMARVVKSQCAQFLPAQGSCCTLRPTCRWPIWHASGLACSWYLKWRDPMHSWRSSVIVALGPGEPAISRHESRGQQRSGRVWGRGQNNTQRRCLEQQAIVVNLPHTHFLRQSHSSASSKLDSRTPFGAWLLKSNQI